MRKVKAGLFILFLITLFSAAFVTAADQSSNVRTFRAELKGSDMVPPVDTKAAGEIVFQFNSETNELNFRLVLENIEDVTAAHIHEGKECQNNPPVVNLYDGRKKAGPFSGTLREGGISEEDFLRSLKEKPVQALIEMIEAGNAYVNVHTDKYPAGEIRGQVKY